MALYRLFLLLGRFGLTGGLTGAFFVVRPAGHLPRANLTYLHNVPTGAAGGFNSFSMPQ